MRAARVMSLLFAAWMTRRVSSVSTIRATEPPIFAMYLHQEGALQPGTCKDVADVCGREVTERNPGPSMALSLTLVLAYHEVIILGRTAGNPGLQCAAGQCPAGQRALSTFEHFGVCQLSVVT